MSARWYKRCGADFIHGTMMLTLEEKGAYSLCLDLIYDRGGPIADDARWLSGVCGVSIRKWNSIRERLISLGKISADDGLLSNRRADEELISTELSSRERAETGAKGGRKRAENAGQTLKNSDLAQAEVKREEKIREDKKETPSSEGVARAPVAKAVRPADFSTRPEWADPIVWADFLANRKRKSLANTPTAYRGFLADIAKHSDPGWPPGRLLEAATVKGHGAIWPSIKEGSGSNGRSNGKSASGFGSTVDAAFAFIEDGKSQGFGSS